jgi:hypothetical protein
VTCEYLANPLNRKRTEASNHHANIRRDAPGAMSSPPLRVTIGFAKRGIHSRVGMDLSHARTGKNGRHALVGMLRQFVFGRLAGCEDVSDALRLRHDPAMRWILGGKAARNLILKLKCSLHGDGAQSIGLEPGHS